MDSPKGKKGNIQWWESDINRGGVDRQSISSNNGWVHENGSKVNFAKSLTKTKIDNDNIS